tara:strand:- start:1644 stop:2861 length:1218 start_codon:yes stop_codon:yes gene_type:complete
MADTKISALPASTTPLAGTEVLPIVQSNSTKQVSVANLTAGRSFDALGMTLTSADAGAAAAPLLELYRDSATPAASDTLGEIEFNGKDSAGNKQAYGLIHASILSPTSTAEQGQIHFETATAGVLTEKMIIGTTNLVISMNVGIGVTPSASTSNYRTLQIGGSARYSIFGQRVAGNCETFVGWNAYGGNNTTTVGTGYYYTNTGDAATLYTQTDTHRWWTAPSGTAGNAITFTQSMTLDASGNLLVGTTTAGAKFTLEYDGGVVVGQNINDSADTTNSTLMQFQIQGTQVGTIKRVAATSAVVYNTTSDVKLKENIADSDSVLEKIQNIKVRQFDWKAGNLHQDYGFIAQELNEVVSGVVTPAETENDMWQLDYSRLTPHLVKAIQEQQALITQLQADIAALKGS